MRRILTSLLLCSVASFASAQITFTKTAYGANQSPNSVASGDFNHDGKPDFVALEAGNQLTIYLNTGSGKFSQKARYAIVTNNNEAAIDTADMNGDGILDIVIVKQFAPEFEIWYGNGDGTFRFGKDISTLSPDAFEFVLADVNHDGKVDLVNVYNDDTSSTAYVYLNDGSANFTGMAGASLPPLVDNFVVADFDGDNKLDLLARIGGQLQEYAGDGAGHFALHSTSTVNSGAGAMTIGSFNHDSILDIALITNNCDPNGCDASKKGKAYIYLNDGKGHFGLRSSYTAGVGFGQPVAGDLNGDGIQDIVAIGDDLVNGNAVPLQYLLNAGDAHFTGPFAAGSFSRQALPVIRDLNRDGRHDLVLPAGSTYTLLNQNAAVTCAPPSSATLSARICGPANNATVSKTFTVKGSGNSPAGVARLELWIDGKKSTAVWNDQIKQSITVTAGTHRVAVVAVDRYLFKTVTAAISVKAQ